ncbi:MAG TPA: arylamine N-acetyltransferase [Streptosporangiaceae bacterium]
MDQTAFVDAYLARLGLPLPEQPDLVSLRALHAAHLQRVPFENLSIHLGEPLSLDREALAEKILHCGRGGFCYELNGLFAELLTALGYRVTLRAACVWGGERLGPPLDHLVLCVECAGDAATWLADVGFGSHSLYPLRRQPGVDQDDPGGVFRVEEAGEGDWDVLQNGVPQYRIEAHPRQRSEFEAMCWYQQTSPRSHFTQRVVCTLQTAGGRVTLSEDRLIRTDEHGKQETVLAGDEAILEAYRVNFGIALDRVPRRLAGKTAMPWAGGSDGRGSGGGVPG